MRLRCGHALAVFALCLSTALAYRPSLGHGPRDDHWALLVATRNEQTFGQHLARTYSYNRHPESPGDHALFRPALFALISAEAALFGHEYACWQAAAVVLHLAAVLLFLRLMLRLQARFAPGDRALLVGAYVFAFFFALNFAVIEMVIFFHINGYLLQLVLVLAALSFLFDELAGPTRTGAARLRLAAGFVLLLAASLAHETGQLFAVLAAAAVAAAAWRAGLRREAVGRFLLLGSVLLLYQGLNHLDQLAHDLPAEYDGAGRVCDVMRVQNTTFNAVRYLLFSLFQPFFPSLAEYGVHRRVHMPEPIHSGARYFDLGPLSLTSYAVVVALAAVTGRRLARAKEPAALLFAALPAGLMTVHLGVTVLGRMNLRGDVLHFNTYYCYLPLLMALLSAYAVHVAGRPETRRVVYPAMLAGLALLTPVSGLVVHRINTDVRTRLYPFRTRSGLLRKLIRQHGHDPSFRLSFDAAFLTADPSNDSYDALFPLFLYARYIDHERPTHVLFVDGGRPKALAAEEYRRRFPHADCTTLPTLADSRNGEYIYRCRGRYYFVHGWDGYYRADRKDYAYLLEGDTLDEVKAQLPALHRRTERDAASGRLIPPNVPIESLDWHEHGLAIYRAGGRYYAIPEDEGPLTRHSLSNGRYSRWHTAATLPELFRQLREAPARAAHKRE